MAMDITQELLDRAALVIVVDGDGLYQWSAQGKTNEQVADYLLTLSGAIREER